MHRYLFFVAIVFVIALSRAGVGAAVQLIEGLPSSYTPGHTITFDVRLPAVSNLGSYNIDVVMESETGTAGVDFFFDMTATMPASTNYVFASSANFFDAVNVDSPSRHRITLTDFDFGGVDVVPGANDQVATVVLQTAPNFGGQLGLRVDADGLILDAPDINPTPVSEFDALRTYIADAGIIEIVPVPEPPDVSLFLVCVSVGCVRRYYGRRV